MKKTILIFDDDAAIAESITENLNHNGFSAFPASTVSSALQVAEKLQPDLVLLDSMMDSSERLGAYYKFKENDLLSSIPIILLASNADEIDEIAYSNCLADDFIIKPVSATILRARIKSFFTKHDHAQKKTEERMNELKNRLSSALPHEFRTSLSGILGYSKIISTYTLHESLGKSEISEIGEMAREINDEGKRLHRLTENFLLYSQIQAMIASRNDKEFISTDSIENPREVILDIIADFSSRSVRKNNITSDLESSPIGVAFYHFYKIIYELIDNAIKFSEAGTIVSITSRIMGCNLRICIQDSGFGMSKDQIKNIAAYNQYDRKLHEQQGTGLGLFIAKLLVELNGGKFSVESCPNEGTIIILDFPVIAANGE